MKESHTMPGIAAFVATCIAILLLVLNRIFGHGSLRGDEMIGVFYLVTLTYPLLLSVRRLRVLESKIVLLFCLIVYAVATRNLADHFRLRQQRKGSHARRRAIAEALDQESPKARIALEDLTASPDFKRMGSSNAHQSLVLTNWTDKGSIDEWAVVRQKAIASLREIENECLTDLKLVEARLRAVRERIEDLERADARWYGDRSSP